MAQLVKSRVLSGAAVVTIAVLLAGCQALYFLGGKGSQEALYKIPPGARVLVFVEHHPSIDVPVGFQRMVAERIADHLYQHKAADQFVPQDRVAMLAANPEKFRDMSLADIAAATNADIVLDVVIVSYNVISDADNAISQGNAGVIVRVVDKQGNRLFPPAGSPGVSVASKSDPAFTSDRDINGMQREMAGLFAVRIGRMFHKFSLDDKDMTK